MNDLPAEREAIKTAIMDYYHQGHVKSDPECYRQILHDEWKIFYFDEQDKLCIADKEEYISWYNPNEVDDSLEWETKIYFIDVYKNNASVKLYIGNQEFGYIDYFNMMKIDGKWWIVHKISQRIDK